MQAQASLGLLTCFALIFAGAMGNIIDSVLLWADLLRIAISWRMWRSSSPKREGMPACYYGKVVDMFYFPMIESVWPTWVPFVGGEPFLFFQTGVQRGGCIHLSGRGPAPCSSIGSFFTQESADPAKRGRTGQSRPDAHSGLAETRINRGTVFFTFFLNEERIL